MAKYINRLASRLARQKLSESKSWIISKHLILETDEGDLEFEKGDVAEIGATPEGDLAIKGNSAAVVIISDADLAAKIAEIVVSSDELSDVEFVDRPALENLLDGENVEDVIDNLADADEDSNEIETAEVTVDSKESVQSKFDKFSENVMHFTKSLVCEALSVEDSDNAPIKLNTVKFTKAVKESIQGYSNFINRVSELNGSIQPGVREIALSEAGEVIGAFDKENDAGILYPEDSFASVEDMDNFDDAPVDLIQDIDFDDEVEEDNVEEALKSYEESEKSGKDYMDMIESLSKAKLSESTIKSIAGTFGLTSLKEGCRIFDTKIGANVKVMKEGVDADNWIEEASAEKGRFTKRFFA